MKRKAKKKKIYKQNLIAKAQETKTKIGKKKK